MKSKVERKSQQTYMFRCTFWTNQTFWQHEIGIHAGGDGEDEPTEEALKAFADEITDNIAVAFPIDSIEAESECEYLLGEYLEDGKSHSNYKVYVTFDFPYTLSPSEVEWELERGNKTLVPTQRALDKLCEQLEAIVQEHYVGADLDVEVIYSIDTASSM